MIFKPKVGQVVGVNYKDKGMPLQGETGTVLAVANGSGGPKNALVALRGWIRTENGVREVAFWEIIARGNLCQR